MSLLKEKDRQHLFKEFATLWEPVKCLVFTTVINETAHLEGAAPEAMLLTKIGCVRGQR